MKKIIAILSIIFLLMVFSGCGFDRNFGNKYCTTYGVFNKEMKCKGVKYKVIYGNIFWAVIFSETLIIPFYFFGFSLYEPIGLEQNME